ncbi:hypothetical protein [Pontivivens nitratireducens]|uniref:hypothetical protein n=1 Tax=Pontivivens nitratireducens TaxID=2758038 RepID=UPI00163A9707|nr:hypothetical protein [Pontibrevibacter nitratireducens]
MRGDFANAATGLRQGCIAAPLMLAACAPLTLGSDSQVERVRSGMSFRDVVAAIGPAQAFEQTRDNRLICTAHIYDETSEPRWIHVAYQEARVVRASDGHIGSECEA